MHLIVHKANKMIVMFTYCKTFVNITHLYFNNDNQCASHLMKANTMCDNK